MDISQILSEALSPDFNQRNQAEIKIDMIASQNFDSFLVSCSLILCDEAKPKSQRQIASTLIKNMISHTAKYKGMWLKLDRENKAKVKQHVISTLASADRDVRKAAGIAVAGICKVELPLGEWTDIIDLLCQTSQNSNQFIQLASVTTLGYISTEITTKDLNDDNIAKILSCFHNLINSSNDNELLEVTMNALLNFLPFTKRFFEKVVIIIFLIFRI